MCAIGIGSFRSRPPDVAASVDCPPYGGEVHISQFCIKNGQGEDVNTALDDV